ncbi:glycoside hydrolase family 57 protein [Desulfurococcus mucosus]|uniref:Alpha-amylase n=1 Tax=Desulfurococcus mucosus (strain ATCC 35584 / DSM 2162 / JCM 9187 / O7/1) TaxID=765177 RepID=E8R985_DESM0|nr:glycoside hydrolase family 57 protein [Desulfurococcus mucosus]ADV65061.1 Alpha-amylase [Desulfurococcus mucosus DSM 2162]
MTDVVLMFEVHQPYRLRRDIHYRLLEKALAGRVEPGDVEEALFDNELNRLVVERASERCYIPATRIILENVKRYAGGSRGFKASFSVSGVFLEQAQRWKPEVVDLFRELAGTGMIEFVEQTYYHSMAAFLPYFGFDELREQVVEHRKLVEELIGYRPTSIENTEFTYSNDVACFFDSMGYRVVLTEGVERVLGWRSPNYVYKAYGCDIRVLTRNYRLSDDIGFRFSDKTWDQYPLTADKYASWIASTPGDLIFIAVDYETFGEHHWPESGIHEFLKWMPGEVLKYGHLNFSTPSEVVERHPVRDVLDVPSWSPISWADERDLSAWLGNEMQREAFNALASIRPFIKAVDKPWLTRLWKLLTISDHLYYMATKFGSIGEVHSYFSPYKNASIAHGLFMEALGAVAEMVRREVEADRRSTLRKLILPEAKAFRFTMPNGEYTGLSAHSLVEFTELLEKAPPESLLYHLNRGDISAWLRGVLGLEDVAREIDELRKTPMAYSEVVAALRRVLKGLVE